MQKNPYYRKVKSALPTTIYCNYCKKAIAHYQKVGKGNLLRMHLDRIVEASFPLEPLRKRLQCPYCEEHLGSLVEDRKTKGLAYMMMRSAVSIEWNY